MSTNDDLPPSPIRSSRNLKEIIEKLQNKHELQEYVEQLTAFNAYHLTDVAEEMRQNLMLQGLDEDDLRDIHKFLLISFDGDLMKTENQELTQGRADDLSGMINT